MRRLTARVCRPGWRPFHPRDTAAAPRAWGARAAAGTGWAPGCSRRRPARRRTPSASGPAHFLAGPPFLGKPLLLAAGGDRLLRGGYIHTHIHTCGPSLDCTSACVRVMWYSSPPPAQAPPGRLTRRAALSPRSAHRRETGLPLSRRLAEKRGAWLLGACACVRAQASGPSVYFFRHTFDAPPRSRTVECTGRAL